MRFTAIRFYLGKLAEKAALGDKRGGTVLLEICLMRLTLFMSSNWYINASLVKSLTSYLIRDIQSYF
jgi:hypothetical protein